MSIRGGTYTEGGGGNIRFSAAKGFNAFDDRFHALVNVQIENGSPIWGYQRDITKQNNPVGYTAQLPSNDFAVIGNADNKLYMMDPTRCANVAGLYDGTTTVGKRASGESCGSVYSAGYKTLKNGKNSDAAAKVGKLVAERAKAAGIEKVAFDRSGYRYHGRIKALADAAREGGLQF